MNNLSSFCGLVDEKIRASDKDLPVLKFINSMDNLLSYCRLVDARISTSEKDLPVHE